MFDNAQSRSWGNSQDSTGKMFRVFRGFCVIVSTFVSGCLFFRFVFCLVLHYLFFYLFSRQPDDLAVDRFVVYEERYRDIREAMTRTTLSASPRELAVALEVGFQLF